MKNGLVIADAGPVFSLSAIDKLSLLTELFDDVKIPDAVWKEITLDDSQPDFIKISQFFKGKLLCILKRGRLKFINIL